MRIGLGLAALGAGVLASISPAAAADPAPSATTTLHGTWYESTELVADTSCRQTSDVSGRWSITLRRDGTAEFSTRLLIHGRLHAAFGGKALGDWFTWMKTADGYLLTMPLATITIEGDQVAFVIPDRYPTCDPSTGVVLGTVR